MQFSSLQYFVFISNSILGNLARKLLEFYFQSKFLVMGVLSQKAEASVPGGSVG